VSEEDLLDRTVGLQGSYAGVVSRFTALVVDVLLSLGIFTLVLSAISYGLNIVTSHSVKWKNHSIVTLVVLVVWEVIYFAYPWSASGKTPGMALLGVRVVRADGGPAGSRNALIRILVLPFSIVLLLIGCVWMLFQRERRAWHDLAAGTAVVYAWDARAARLRFLARQKEMSAPVVSPVPPAATASISPHAPVAPAAPSEPPALPSAESPVSPPTSAPPAPVAPAVPPVPAEPPAVAAPAEPPGSGPAAAPADTSAAVEEQPSV
jgi:uncharacterized RDD family membrane protein YckC